MVDGDPTKRNRQCCHGFWLDGVSFCIKPKALSLWTSYSSTISSAFSSSYSFLHMNVTMAFWPFHHTNHCLFSLQRKIQPSKYVTPQCVNNVGAGKNCKHIQFTSYILMMQNMHENNVSLIDTCTWHICSKVWDRDRESDTQVRPSCSSEIPPATNNGAYFDHRWMELLFLDLAYWAKKEKPSIYVSPYGNAIVLFSVWDLKTFSCSPDQHGVHECENPLLYLLYISC